MAIKEVGRVGIRGVPNVKNFREELKRDLAKIERYYDANPVEIAAKIDSSNLRREAAVAAKSASGHSVEFRSNLNRDEIDAQMQKLRKDLERLETFRLKFDRAGTSTLSQQIADIESKLRGLSSQKFSVDVDPVFKHTNLKAVGIDLQVNPDSERSVQSALARVEAELEKFKMLELKAVLDEDGLKKVHSQLADMQADLDKRPITLQVDFDSTRSLDLALAEIDRRLEQAREVPIEVELDHDSLARVRGQLEAARQFLEAESESRPVELEVDFGSKRSIDSALAQLDSALSRTRAVKVPVSLDRDSILGMKAELEAAKQALEGVGSIKLDVDTNDLSSMEAALREIQKQRRTPLEVDLDDSSLARAEFELQALIRRRRVADVVVRLRDNVARESFMKLTDFMNRYSGLNLMTDIADHVGEIFQNFDTLAVKAGTFGTIIGGIATTLTSMVASLVSIGGDLVAIGGIFWAAPAFVAAAGISAVTLVAAFKDIGEHLGDLQDDFSEIQSIISDTFWNHAEEPIRRLVQNQLPALRSGFRGVADAMGSNTAAFSSALDAALDGKLEGMFDNLEQSIRNSRGAMEHIAGSIATLGEVGSRYLPRFGTWLTDITGRFDSWLTDAANDGRLEEWIDNGIEQLGYLSSSIGSVTGILQGLFSAADDAGYTGLEGMAETLERIDELVNSPKFQDGLARVFEGARKGMTEISEGFQEVLDVIGTMDEEIGQSFENIGSAIGDGLGIFADIIEDPAFQQGLVDFTDGIDRAVEGLEPMAGHIGETIGLLGSGFGGLLGALGEELGEFEDVGLVFNDILRVVGPLSEQLVRDLGAALRNILPPILNLVRDLLPSLEDLFYELGNSVKEASTVLGPLLDLLADLTRPMLISRIERLSDTIEGVKWDNLFSIDASDPEGGKRTIEEELWKMFTMLSPGGAMNDGFFRPILETTTRASGEWLRVVGNMLSDGALEFGNFIEDVGTNWDTFWSDLESVLEIESTNFGESWDEFWGGFGDGWDQLWIDLETTVTTWWEDLTSGSDGNWGTFLEGWTINGETLTEWWDSLWKGILELFGIDWESIELSATEGMNRLLEMFGVEGADVEQWWSDLWTEVQNIFGIDWAELESTIQTEMAELVTEFQNLPGRIKTGLGDLSETLWNAGVQLMSGFGIGIEVEWSDVKMWIQSLPRRIVATLGNLGSILWNAGRSILTGLLDGLQSKWQEVKDFVSGIAPWIQQNKGPEAYDKQLLVRHGGWIMDGLDKGLADGFVTVQRRVSGMAGKIESSFGSERVSAFTNGASGVSGGITVTGPLIQVDELVVDSDERVQEVAQALYERGQRVERANGRVSLEGAMV